MKNVFARLFNWPLAALLVVATGAGCVQPQPNAKAAAASPESGITAAEIRAVVQRVARRQIHPLADGEYPAVQSLEQARAARPPAGIEWIYPWGVTLAGLIRSTEVTGDDAPANFAREHNRICARYHAWLLGLRQQFGASAEMNSLVRGSKIARLMNLGNLDSCGAMGVQLLDSTIGQPAGMSPEEKTVAARIADWIVNRQDRLPDGTLWRAKQMGGTVWPDDLYMGCPFLVRWARQTGDQKYLDDAARQIVHQAALEQDADGLWFHGYFVSEKKTAPFKWGRGNGWVMVATVEVLSALPENHPDRARLIEILRKQIAGLKPLQAPDGMWRQVLDHPELWEETSCTAMFTYGIARAANRGWIDAADLGVARKAFAGLAKNVSPEGHVNGTCEGTNIGRDLDFYIQRQHPLDDIHGPGPLLLAGTELLLAKPK